MTPEEIPQELIDLLDRRAGKAHSCEGQVVTTLAEILTRYEETRLAQLDPRRLQWIIRATTGVIVKERVCRDISQPDQGRFPCSGAGCAIVP